MVKLILLAWLFMQNVFYSNGEGLSLIPNPVIEESEEIAYEKLLVIENSMKSGIESLIKQAMPMLIGMGTDVEVSGNCMASLLKWITAIKNMKSWAFQMLDATGKPEAGILRGKPAFFGSYQECMKLVIPGNNQDSNAQKPPQTGQYCIVSLQMPVPPRPKIIEFFAPVFQRINATFKTEFMNEYKSYIFANYDTPMKLGVCIPSTCTKNDLNEMISLAGKQIGLYTKTESCELPEDFKLDTMQIVVISILTLFGVTCFLATVIVEVISHRVEPGAYNGAKESMFFLFLRCFSLINNFKKLMKTKPAEKNSLDCLNGIRYISATWVILGHAYILYDRFLFNDYLGLHDYKKDIFLTAICNAFLSVESFLLITSLLVSYTIVTSVDCKKPFNPIIAVLRRLWRMLPGVVLMMGVSFLLPLVTSGPEYKHAVEDWVQNCRENWWTNLIFIGNFIPFNKMCMVHTWYVAVDFQLFIVAMLYFLLLFRKPLFGHLFLIFSIIASVVSSGLMTYIKDFPPAVLIRYPDIGFAFEYANYVYIKPHVHLGVYAVGLFAGTYLARNPKLKMSQWTSVIGWIIASVSGLVIVYSIFPWNRGDEFTLVAAITYSALQRTTWGVCVALVAIACFADKGGYVNEFLSWPGFQPLVKISYQLYLIHVPVYWVYVYSKQESVAFNHTNFVFTFFGVFCATHVLAVIVRLFFEAPLIEIERMFCSWLFRGSKSKNINGELKVTNNTVDEVRVNKETEATRI